MKKIITLFTALFLNGIFISTSYSQGLNFEWANGIGGTDFDQAVSAVTDKFGNTYITGIVTDTVDFDPTSGTALLNASYRDIFVAKYNVTGNYEWAFNIKTNGNGRSHLAIDNMGDIYLTGNFHYTVDFDPSSNTNNLLCTGNQDIFLAKYNSSGIYQWAKSFEGNYYNDVCDIILDSSGNIYLSGWFNGSTDFDPSQNVSSLIGYYDIFIAKYDNTGSYLWAKSFTGTSGDTGGDIGRALAVDNAGYIYVTGEFEEAVDFDPSISDATLTTIGQFSAFLAKYDFNGNYIWAKNITSTGSILSNAIAIDNFSNLYLTGFFMDTVDFDPSNSVANLSSPWSIFLAKYDVDGNYEWANQLSGSAGGMGNSLLIDTTGNIYIAGEFRDTLDFNPSSNTSNLISLGGTDIFLAKYMNNGNYIWAKNIGSSSSDAAFDLAFDGVYNVYVTGSFDGSADFNFSEDSAYLNSKGSGDIFLAKYNHSNTPPLTFN